MKKTVGSMAHREDMDKEETGDNKVVTGGSREDIRMRTTDDKTEADTGDMVSNGVAMADMDNTAEIVDSRVVSADTVVMDREDTENRKIIIRTMASTAAGKAVMAVRVVTEIKAAAGAARVAMDNRAAAGDKAVRAATGAVRAAMDNKVVLAVIASRAIARKTNTATITGTEAMASGIKKMKTTMTITNMACRAGMAVRKTRTTGI